MARRTSKKKGRKDKKKSDSEWVQLGSICEGKNGQYIKIDNEEYKKKDGETHMPRGRILFEDFETETIYEISSMSIFEPGDKAPDFILDNIKVNLKGDQVEDVTEDFE